MDKLTNDIKNKKTNRKNTVEKLNNIVSDLDQQRQKESTVFQNKMIDVVYYLFNSLGISSKPGRLKLPNWVEISEKRFNEILSTVTKAKNEGLRTNVDEREITLDNTESLLNNLGHGLVDGHEFKNRYNDIVDDIKAIVDKSSSTRNKKKVMSLSREILKTKSTEQPDTTNMPELKSEESAAERRNQPRKGLKISTPDQMLSKLPISLAQLKAGNNSQILKNEIRQLFYSLYRSKSLQNNSIKV